ncbi:TetR/AcrR family transcriptional regulator [Phytoactinopolyspora mesophila]|nr:TetR/AcrR family transcriptional regulator [Phytoactinopolyspora mesophila]
MSAGERRQQIARTAAELFEQRGYYRSGVDDIAEAVGVAKPTLYHYLGSKADIVAIIHEDVVGRLAARLEHDTARKADPRVALREFAAGTLEVLETKTGFLRVAYENQLELPKTVRGEAQRKRDRIEELVQVQIEEGIRRGIFRETNSRLAALFFLGMINWSYHWYRPGEEFSPGEVCEHVMSIFLDGVAVRV